MRLKALIAGINYNIVRTWNDVDRNFERKLKNKKSAKTLCPICNPKSHGKEIKESGEVQVQEG